MAKRLLRAHRAQTESWLFAMKMDIKMRPPFRVAEHQRNWQQAYGGECIT
jgi:hypothetical protein